MDGKTSIVDKAAICGRTYTARCKAASHFVCAESFCGLKKIEKMKKKSLP